MSFLNSVHSVPLWKMLLSLAIASLLGLAAGTAIGLKIERPESLLVQEGEIPAIVGYREIEVFYPKPYGSPPQLKLLAPYAIDYQFIKQTPLGFSIKFNSSTSSNVGRYQATGVPAK